MIRAEAFVAALHDAGFRVFSGTPCSYLTPLINRVIDAAGTYIGAANEGDAVAVAAGAELGGLPGVVLFQNSGLGNAVNPLTSLTYTFRIPVLVIVTWRAEPGGPADEPQHELMGRITTGQLDLMGIPWEAVPADEASLAPLLGRANAVMRDTGRPFALVLRHGTVAPYQLRTRPAAAEPFRLEVVPPGEWPRERLRPDEVLAAVQAAVGPGDAVLATTGFTGRALYALADRPSQFYMVGSMGCASSLGLGLARARPDRRVVVLDGDGAVLMRMGALATIGHERPPNLVHVLLDNAVHDSTGAQATVSPGVDLSAVAAACGYPAVHRVAALIDDLTRRLRDHRSGLSFLHVLTRPRDSHALPRPTVMPEKVAARFRRWLADGD